MLGAMPGVAMPGLAMPGMAELGLEAIPADLTGQGRPALVAKSRLTVLVAQIRPETLEAQPHE